jgi:hypothetical protein
MNILDVECAGGTPLPYKGYIEANIKMPGDTNTTCQHVMLVVPDSSNAGISLPFSKILVSVGVP